MNINLEELKKIYPEVPITRSYMINETGNKYGKLTVLYRTINENNTRHASWVCQCECGAIKVVQGRHLRNGETTSCHIYGNHPLDKNIRQQRSRMTQALREKIKKRDNYTCQICGLSTQQEPHLLFEIDHIIPVSKGGLTEENNLRTLCWMCNRAKSDK